MSFLAPLLLLAGAMPAAHAAPNLLVIVADDVGVDKVGVYAASLLEYTSNAPTLPATPNIDNLAASGLRFTAAWSNPVCSPTRAGLLTGRHAWRTGVGDTVPEGPELDPDAEVTLADILADATTGEVYASAVFGKWHLGDSPSPPGEWTLGEDDGYLEIGATAHPLRAGFQWYEGSIIGAVESYTSWTKTTARSPEVATLATETDHPTDVTVDDALAWIGVQVDPWLAVVAFNAAHTDLDTGRYDVTQVPDGCHSVSCVADRSCRSNERAIYQAQVECLDTAVGELLAGISSSTLDETIVVFLSDNGTPGNLVEGPYANLGGRTTTGKGTAYQSGVNVPLVIAQGSNYAEYVACTDAERASGLCRMTSDHVQRPGRTLAGPVLTTDLFATLAELGGRTATTGVDSLSLGGCLSSGTSRCNTAATAPTRVLYTEQFLYAGEQGGGSELSTGLAAIRQGNNKLIAQYSSTTGCLAYELYDLSSDAFERTNLTTTQPAVVRQLSAVLSGLGVSWLAPLRGCRTS